MLDPRRLQVLAAVARHGSASAAAQALGLTQPAVSHHLARLSEEAGMAVVRRVPGGVAPTEAGALLARAGDALAARLAAAEDELAALREGRAGRAVLAGFPTTLADLLPRAAAALADDRPGLDVRLRQLGGAAAIAALRAGEVDVAVVADPPAAEAAGLEPTLLLRDPFLVVLARHHRLAARKRLTLSDLAAEPWVHGTATPTHGERALAAAGLTAPDVVLRTDDLLAVQGIVAAGRAVALVPGLGLANTRRDVVTRAVAAADLHRDVVALTLADPSPATGAAVEALREAGEALAS
jgi:molybdate transport repressor ModE-like protein